MQIRIDASNTDGVGQAVWGSLRPAVVRSGTLKVVPGAVSTVCGANERENLKRTVLRFRNGLPLARQPMAGTGGQQSTLRGSCSHQTGSEGWLRHQLRLPVHRDKVDTSGTRRRTHSLLEVPGMPQAHHDSAWAATLLA